VQIKADFRQKKRRISMNKKLSVALAVVLLAAMTTSVFAQVSYGNPWFTSYQVANLGGSAATIHVQYYDEDGNTSSAMDRDFPGVPIGGSVTVQQSVETTLGQGVWSAVVSSDQPIAAVANQQLGQSGSTSSIPPFSSYSAVSEGSTEVVLPSIMYNWYGYYTEIYIQNVGTADATNVDITYYPTTYAGCLAGATGQADNNQAVDQYASKVVSQVAKTNLGASGLTGSCASFNGRFLGSAKITADQPIAVVVNEHVQGKLFTYNGFEATGATNIVLPAYMRNYYGYYAAVVIANPGTSDAIATLTYTNGPNGTSPTGKQVVTADHTVPAGKSITVYEGPTDTSSDLAGAGYAWGGSYRFFGTLKISSTRPVVALVNQESRSQNGAQAGSYNGAAITEGSAKISVPLIQSDFYGYYTSLTIMTVDGGNATVKITYTSDGTYSSVKNTSKSYTLSTTGGFLNRYEGSSATAAQSDILDDTATWADGGGTHRFIGSAVIEVTSGSNIVAFVNSESSTAQGASSTDSMYTYNAFNQ
jgi:hypothetical protein